MYETVMSVSAYVAMVITFIGLSTFLWLYRPMNPRRHGRAGAHLINTFWALWALYFVSLVQPLQPLPLRIGLVVQLVVLVAIMFVVWQRVHLLLDFRRGELDARNIQDELVRKQDLENNAERHAPPETH